MSIESPPFAIQAEGSTTPAEQARRAVGFLTSRGATVGSTVGGVRVAGDLALSVGTGLQVKVGGGELLIPGSLATTQGGYYTYGTQGETGTLTLSAASASYPRVDRIVARVFDSQYSGTEHKVALEAVTGTPTSGATLANKSGVAAAPANSYTIGYALVPANAVSLTAEDLEYVAQVVTIDGAHLVAGTVAWTALNGTLPTTKVAAASLAAEKLAAGTIVNNSESAAKLHVSYGSIAASGGVAAGSGDFSVEHTGTGIYRVNWSTARAGAYHVVVSPGGGSLEEALASGEVCQVYHTQTSGFTVYIGYYTGSSVYTAQNAPWCFTSYH